MISNAPPDAVRGPGDTLLLRNRLEGVGLCEDLLGACQVHCLLLEELAG